MTLKSFFATYRLVIHAETIDFFEMETNSVH